jgi:hypothetical protein
MLQNSVNQRPTMDNRSVVGSEQVSRDGAGGGFGVLAERRWQGLVQPQGREAVHDRPGGRAAELHVRAGVPAEQRADTAVERFGRAGLRGLHRLVLGMVELGPEHDLEVRTVSDREAHVRHAHLVEVVGALLRVVQCIGQ